TASGATRRARSPSRRGRCRGWWRRTPAPTSRASRCRATSRPARPPCAPRSPLSPASTSRSRSRSTWRRRCWRWRGAPPEHRMAAPIIRTTGLTKRFGDFTAVDALGFEVAAGSIFAFLGANGSGKSTTIRMLIGLLRPTAGAIEVDGVDVIRTPRRVRDHIGYMGQKVSLYQGPSLRENVQFYPGPVGLQGGPLEPRTGELPH